MLSIEMNNNFEKLKKLITIKNELLIESLLNINTTKESFIKFKNQLKEISHVKS